METPANGKCWKYCFCSVKTCHGGVATEATETHCASYYGSVVPAFSIRAAVLLNKAFLGTVPPRPLKNTGQKSVSA